ncbi:hypothetical protein HEP85_27295 [Streptomyces sp. RPA4-2]|uniref:hypothetical protein n=1 Tax=Streptomyces sp. RPA4-2 TaxID=2721244 RepID=UPI00143E8BF2|nr:hypothetical protein [Streptomyces sp. RPA4-2]QIY64651.1 hypothetical protein HEP85_27295 [Streptomyces sp. RPA4-2]
MSGVLETIERRLRRLTEMQRTRAVAQAGAALREVWRAGKQPDLVKLRAHLLYAREEGQQPPLTHLLNPRGIALRFYLLAVFEAHCRLNIGEPWKNVRSLARERLSWSDFVAIDGAYDTKTGAYMPDTKQERNSEVLRLRQIQGALRSLEDFDLGRSLVTVPRAKNGGRRLYGSFSLMSEEGRGDLQTSHAYTVPRKGWNGKRTLAFTIPADFFLNGWVQVLNPSEVATWLILRELSQYAPTKHDEEGVYLYGKRRIEDFGLKRDAWQDSCHLLRKLGLIRYYSQESREGGDGEPDGGIVSSGWGDFFAQQLRDRYEPHRYQMTDQGLTQDALQGCIKEVTLLRAEARRKRGASVPAQPSGRTV